ncbi:kinase-like domain-containing protein, partial [Dimargaris cristalligena]
EFRKRRKDESEKEYVKKLTSEFCISSTMRHPNIVETVDLVQDQQQRWCQVMEYCPGGDLYTVIREGNMAGPEIDCCFRQMVQGVAYLHSMGVAHRDIKPENLLVDAYGHVKITDFGVADVFRMCWENTTHMSRGFCGSEPYIAPEQFSGKPYDARKVDVWSCGVVLYAMYCKGVPFRTATKHDPNYVRYLEAKASGKVYEPFRKLPPKASALIAQMLEPDVEKRISIQDIVDDSWVQSIELCNNGETPSKQHHQHFTEDYALNQLKHPSNRRS